MITRTFTKTRVIGERVYKDENGKIVTVPLSDVFEGIFTEKDVMNVLNKKYKNSIISIEYVVFTKEKLEITDVVRFQLHEDYNKKDCDRVCYVDTDSPHLSGDNKGFERELAKLFLNKLYGKSAMSDDSK